MFFSTALSFSSEVLLLSLLFIFIYFSTYLGIDLHFLFIYFVCLCFSRGFTWESTWFEQPDGSREVVELKKSKGSVRGEKSGKAPDGEAYCERYVVG